MKKEDLISEIEEAFGRDPCPRGIKITIDSDEGDYPDVRKHFHHKNWWTLDAKYLKSQDGAFTFMTEEAQLYFTPAFMIASLVDPCGADTVPDDFVWNLSDDLLRMYSNDQIQAVIHFIEFHLSDSRWNYRGWKKYIALAKEIEQAAPRNR